MPTGLTYKIHDGSAKELPDIIANLMQGFFFDFRDGTKLTPLDDLKKQHARKIEEARRDLDTAHQDLLNIKNATDAELLAAQVARLSESALRRAEQEEVIARYVAAEAKLEAWTPPESVQQLKDGMLRHLREQIDYERDLLKYVGSVDTPKTAEEIRASRIEWRERDVKNAEERLAKEEEDGERLIAFRTELYAELKRIGLKV